jgi:hypothetical protein
MISVQTQIEIQGDLNLANISQKLDEINIPKEILKSVLAKLQDEVVKDLCGVKYLRSTKGLENLMKILLARYCNRRFYGGMKERYLSPNTTQIQMAIT